MIAISEQAQYKTERNQILREIKNYHKMKGNDFNKILDTFLNDLTIVIKSIQNDPCRNPDFPAPVKKKLLSKGTIPIAF